MSTSTKKAILTLAKFAAFSALAAGLQTVVENLRLLALPDWAAIAVAGGLKALLTKIKTAD